MNFIDAYLEEIEKHDKHLSFTKETLIQVCADLFSAGSESVSDSIAFTLLYSILYPEWQERVYQEIKAYVDSNSSSFINDRKR